MLNKQAHYIDPEYHWIKYYLYYYLNPLQFIKSPIGKLLGKMIAPTQYNDDNLPYITSKIGFKTNFLYLQSNNNIGQASIAHNINRKLIVYFNGNGENLSAEELKNFGLNMILLAFIIPLIQPR